MIITREIAKKVRDVVAVGLVEGVGVAEPGKMCVEAAVCYALGLPHGDDPGCVDPAVRRLKISLNDKPWTSNEARARGLRRLAIAQLGSLGAINTIEFSRRVATMTIRTMVPLALRATARRNPKHADRLEVAAAMCEKEPTREHALKARDASSASSASSAAASDAAYAAASDAAYAAASAAAYAAAAYDYAASAAYAAAYAAASAAADQRAKILSAFAESVVQILVEMKAPGCEFLDLVPLEVA